MKVDPKSGVPVKATSKGAIYECFMEGTTPEEADTIDPANVPGAAHRFDTEPE